MIEVYVVISRSVCFILVFILVVFLNVAWIDVDTYRQKSLGEYFFNREAEEGLVAWWIGGPSDIGNNTLINPINVIPGLDGTLVNFSNPPTLASGWNSGRMGIALAFDGVDDEVTVPDNDVWSFTGGDFTMSVWVMLRSLDAFGPVFISQDDGGGGGNDKWLFMWTGAASGAPAGDQGKTAFHVNVPPGGAGDFIWATGNAWTPSLDVWVHLAVTRLGDVYTFYRDGIFDGTETHAFAIPNASNDLMLGAAEVVFQIDGFLHDVRIYTRALDQDEVSNIMRYTYVSSDQAQTLYNPSFESGVNSVIYITID
jgi:hypothetical protein